PGYCSGLVSRIDKFNLLISQLSVARPDAAVSSVSGWNPSPFPIDFRGGGDGDRTLSQGVGHGPCDAFEGIFA
ncbi:MAG: hypothetical protein WB974_15860, partial [Acidobacteriaceae bacterium]